MKSTDVETAAAVAADHPSDHAAGHQPAVGADRSAAPTDDDGWQWAIVEIFGHRRHAGRCREQEQFGAKMLRIDVPKATPEPTLFDSADGKPSQPLIVWETHFYGGSAIFSFTPTDEASVMRANRGYAPPSLYRLPAPDHPAGDDEY